MTKGILCLPFSFLSRKEAHIVCLDGGLHPGEEESREHPRAALPALVLKVTQSDPPAQQRWQIQVRQPKQLLPGLFALLPAQLFRAAQGDRANRGRDNLHLPTFQTAVLDFALEKRKLERVYKSRASESTAQIWEWCASCSNDSTGLGLGFPPSVVLFCFFSITALAKGRVNRIISKRKPGNGGKQQISLTTKDSSLQINTWKAERIQQIASGMHKLCHILNDSRFWDTVRTAWEEDSDECLYFLLWHFDIHPFCLKWSHSFHYPWNHLLNSSLFSLSGAALFFFL